jgi:6-phosphogluconate dehydrogenase
MSEQSFGIVGLGVMGEAQRDYFGAHTYQRVDRPGKFHTQWTQQ